MLLWGAAFGAAAVMLGAFGAHSLKATLQARDRVDVFETAVRYQMYHALALLLLGTLMMRFDGKLLKRAALCWVAGVLLFSGSLYVICFASIGLFGLVTPLGGLLLVAGWVCLLLNSWTPEHLS